MAYQPAFDVSRLRQQNIFNPQPIPDMSGGSMGMGMDDMPMNYPMQQQSNVMAPSAQEPSTSPTFPIPKVPSYERSPAPEPESISSKGGLTTEDLAKLVNQFYTPDTTSRDRFNKLLDTAPERNNPSWARKIVAGGIGIGAKDDPVGEMEKVMYAPYNRDMTAWKEKAVPFSQASQQENTANINERTLAGNIVTAKVNTDRYAAQNEASMVRARAYQWKQMHPDWDWDTTGPTYVLKGPGGEIKDTGIKTGELSAQDLQLLKNKGAVDSARARGEAAIAQDWVPYQDPAGNKYYINPNVTAGPKMQPGPGSPETPTGPLNRIGTPRAADTDTPKEMGERQQLKWREIYDNNPQYQKFFKRNQNGSLTLGPAPTMGSWMQSDAADKKDIADYEALRKMLYPNYKGGPTGETPAGTPDATGQGGAKANTVPDSQGRMIQLPPPTQQGVQPIVQEKAGKFRISYDGGKTFRPFTPTYIGK